MEKRVLIFMILFTMLNFFGCKNKETVARNNYEKELKVLSEYFENGTSHRENVFFVWFWSYDKINRANISEVQTPVYLDGYFNYINLNGIRIIYIDSLYFETKISESDNYQKLINQNLITNKIGLKKENNWKDTCLIYCKSNDKYKFMSSDEIDFELSNKMNSYAKKGKLVFEEFEEIKMLYEIIDFCN